MNLLDSFQNPDGSGSSRRIFGALIIVYAIVANAFKLIDGSTLQVLVGIGGTLLLSTTADWHKPGGGQ